MRFLLPTLLSAFILLSSCGVSSQSQNNADSAKTTAGYRDSVLLAVSACKTNDALKLMNRTDKDMSLALQQRFDNVSKQYSLGLIGFGDWSRTMAQINYAIVESLPEREKEARPVPTGEIQDWIKAGKTREALQALAAAGYSDAFLLLARLCSLQEAFDKGTVDADTRDQVMAQINFAVLEFEQWQKGE